MSAVAHPGSAGLRPSFHAALLLAVGMGIGRFSFTALYPYMVAEGLIDVATGGLAASANYAGYLLGAILAVRTRAHNARAMCVAATLGTVACLALLGLANAAVFIVVVRGLAGAFSALAMVAASTWLLEHRKHAHGAPLLYGGVGIGIAVSAELLVAGVDAGLQSHGLWWLLTAVSAVTGLVALAGLAGPEKERLAAEAVATPVNAPPTPPASPAVNRAALTAVYALAGFGYIITATYLPLLMSKALPGTNVAHTWALFGLSAAPSCYLWHFAHRRLGTSRAMAINLLVQAFGVSLPVFSSAAAAHMLSAILVGGTFLGVVTIAMPAAQRISRATGSNLMAQLTVVYSLGQIAGPLLASALFGMTQSFNAALVTASAALCVAAAISLRRF